MDFRLHTFNIFPIQYVARYRRYCDYVLIQGAIIPYPRRASLRWVPCRAVTRYTLLFTSSSSPSPLLPPFVYRERNGTYRCINQARYVDRNNKGWRNGNGKERGRKKLDGGWNFAGKRKIGRRGRRGRKRECKSIYVHAQGRGYIERKGGWRRVESAGKQAYIAPRV